MSEEQTDQLIDPYANAPDLFRAHFSMSRYDWLWLKSLSPYASNNTISDRDVTMRVITKKLINELKRIGINQYDPTAFRKAIAAVTITINLPRVNDPSRTGSAVALLREQNPNGQALETDNRNDGRGISGVPLVAQETPPQPTGIGGTSPGQASGGKGTREGKKRKGVS